MKTTTDQLAREIAKSLDGYNEDVESALMMSCKELAENAKKEVKSLAPKRKGSYKASITMEKTGDFSYTIYAKKPHYRLTHLLEYGHALRGGGRSKAFPHWKPAEETVIQNAVKTFKEKL